ATDAVRQTSKPAENVWEAVWCGNDALAAVMSPAPGEGLWYSARLALIQLSSEESQEIYKPRDQLGWPASSPSGKHVAVVDALCSDRWIVAGDLIVIDRSSGESQAIDTRGVDIAYTEWRSDRILLLAGHRGFETVVGLYDVQSSHFTEVSASHELTV